MPQGGTEASRKLVRMRVDRSTGSTGDIERIRRQVGHDLVMTVGCGGVIEDNDGRILLQRRKDNGLWCIPGGHVEPGEYILDTLRREVMEETGLLVGDAGLFGIYSGPDGHFFYPNGDEVASVQIVLRATVTHNASIRPSDDESTAHAFFSRDDLPAPSDLWIVQRRIVLDWLTGQAEPFLC